MNKGTVICTDEFTQNQMAENMLLELMEVESYECVPVFDGIYRHIYTGLSTLFTEPSGIWECTFSYDTETNELTPKLRKYAER